MKKTEIVLGAIVGFLVTKTIIDNNKTKKRKKQLEYENDFLRNELAWKELYE